MKVGVVGCTGRMGRLLVHQALEAPDCTLEAATTREGNPHVGEDAATLVGLPPSGVTIGDDAVALYACCDVVIDFTIAALAVEHGRLAAQAKAALVIGTTGLSQEAHEALAAAARHTPIVMAPNTSLGVAVLGALVEKAAATLPEGYDIEIVEMHHRNKVDAPSGTALFLGEAAARGRGIDLASRSVRSRDGHTGARPAGDIGFATLRGGDVVGEHTVILAGPGERIELSHRAGDRSLFAQGALTAARWAFGQPPGLYSMRDVLGL